MSTIELTEAPRLGRLYRRAALASLARACPARGAGADGRRPPVPELVLRGVVADRGRLARYDRVCGFRLRDRLPATYPQVLALPLTMQLMTEPGFGLPLIGLVHLANRIEVYRPLTAEEPLELRVRAEDQRPHERGRQLDVVVEARLHDQPVWSSRATYLQRRGPSRPASPATAGDPAAQVAGGEPAAQVAGGEPAAQPAGSVLWRVGADTGRAYAAVSGDRNPIHTSRTAARLLGFRRPIAHGMWTMARCLAAIEGRLPDRYTVDVTFRAPILLPATVAFQAVPGACGRWQLTVGSARSGRRHLTGAVTPG